MKLPIVERVGHERGRLGEEEVGQTSGGGSSVEDAKQRIVLVFSATLPEIGWLTDNDLYNEQEILRRVAQGDEQAYKELFARYWGKVYSIALLFAKVPEVAEDAAQDVFAQLWVKRGLLENVLDFQAYLYTTARNIIYNKLRTRIYAGEFNEYLREYFADTQEGPVSRLELKEVSQIIEDGIRSLTPQQEKVFRLSRFQGLSHEEIARETGLSKRTIKNYMVSAIVRLRQYLQQHQGSLPIFLWMLFFL